MMVCFISQASLLDSKLISTPLEAGESLTSDGPAFDDLRLYCSFVGALQYLTITRFD